jgi:hypothetical protein
MVHMVKALKALNSWHFWRWPNTPYKHKKMANGKNGAWTLPEKVWPNRTILWAQRPVARIGARGCIAVQ